jgi:hypothetical protein
MPEIKNQFTGGKMEKDLDERLVPNGQYRDAMNIQVATSEGSEVGTVQNILGNRQILLYGSFNISPSARTICCIADEKNDTLYYLVWDTTSNYVMSYSRGDSFVRPVFVDHHNILGFESNTQITGINIIDDMLFWTDNKTEPKKINIPRSRLGTPTFNNHTKFINKGRGFAAPSNSPNAEEKHITVIKKGPNIPLRLQLGTSRDPNKIYTGVITITNDATTSDIKGPDSANFSSFSVEDGSNTLSLIITKAVNQMGDVVTIGPVNNPTLGLNGWWDTPNTIANQGNILVGTKIVLKPFLEDEGLYVVPGLPVTDYVIKAEVIDADTNTASTTWHNGIKIKIISIDGYPPVVPEDEIELNYVVDLWDETEKLFEFKFPRFSYRYKYEDGEYSTFAPWTPVAFQPGAFDYHPRKGYNLGMTNTINKVNLLGLVTPSTPKDVISIDILFKDEPSPNIYVVDTIRPDDSNVLSVNKWNSILNGNPYSIKKETINSVVPSNQLLRTWDNVPRKALAQDVTGNRIVYGNYVQNYDLLVGVGSNLKKYVPRFTFEWGEYQELEILNGVVTNTRLAGAGKSIKSLREYQLGVVFVDKYGRETPVISNETGTKKLEKNKADKYNRINASINTLSNFPNHQDLKYFKFYVKETSGEYYNMAMDRWYDAEDGNVWLAFPSSDRNKLDIDTFLIIKKGTDKDDLVTDTARYKVIAIENEAPDFVKTKRQLAVSLIHGTAKNMYGTALSVNGPVQGRGKDTNIEINYQAFLTTPGMHLDEYTGGKLYIEWENTATKQVSDRYEIVSIDNDFDKDSGSNNPITMSEAVYSIQLAKNLGDDVNFITDDASGRNPTKINYGTKTNIYKYVVENRPQFDGRFFVKIYEDETFQVNIGKSYIDGLDYRVVNSKKVFYMKREHRLIHTSDIDDFLVQGNDQAPNSLIVGSSEFPQVLDNLYGYYAIREFASMALFFRRYSYGTAQRQALGLFGDYTQYGNTPVLAHLKPGVGNFQSYPNSWVNSLDLDSQYLSDIANPNWTPVSNWNTEYGAKDDFALGYTNNFIFYNAQMAVGISRVEETVHTDADNARDTEVWFIDEGPYAGKAYDTVGNGDFSWSSQHRYETFDAYSGGSINPGTAQAVSSGTTDNLTSMPELIGTLGDYPTSTTDDARWHRGIANSAQAHAMTLAFGGIEGAEDNNSSPGHFNIGNWNTGSGATPNVYSDLEPFVRNFNSGHKFRWKQDPSQTIYTIGGDITSENYLRHSTNRSQTIASFNRPEIAYGATSMAELLSFNFTKNWTMKTITPAYGTNWYPLADGEMLAGTGLEINLTVCDSSGSTTGTTTATGNTINDDLIIYVTNIIESSTNTDVVSVGMAFSTYTKADGTPAYVLNSLSDLNTNPDGINDFLVIRRIEKLGDGSNTYYALTLGGYRQPLRTDGEHQLAADADLMPQVNSTIKFVQVGMNGYSPNSEFNINTIAKKHTMWGAITAVGYDIEFIEYIEPEEILSENPAIFETEPKELPELDIYYEASADIPMVIDEDTVSTAFPIGSTLFSMAGFVLNVYNVVGHSGSRVLVQPTGIVNSGEVTCIKLDGVQFTPTIIDVQTVGVSGLGTCDSVEFSENLYNLEYKLNWHNCFSFGNGVESNRIRDNYNLPYIANGVKVSTTLEYDYKEEHRKHGLIYSGLYNAISGVNNLNQFIQAEKITKDINPIYGSIQKLHARDSDLVTLCEDKVLKILSQKDALYNADGNINLTATERVLGQAIPFAGEHGISTNPESFASENYRAYFADRVRGAVLRLSMDGLTTISDAGMKDWFRDNLKLVNSGRIIGSYDDRNDEYVLKLEFVDPTTILPTVYGCTDPLATNYAPLATSDNGSCLLLAPGGGIDPTFSIQILGCIDPTAPNYNPLANTDDGSCIAVVFGCMDQTANNYLATTNTACIVNSITNGCCTYDVYGCTDMTACNYPFMQTPPPTIDDGSCIYPMANANCLGVCNSGYYIANPNSFGFGPCVAIPAVVGCMDATANNYDPSANTACIVNFITNGCCTYDVYGCTDTTACNYPFMQTAPPTIDDGSCIYPIPNGNCSGGCLPGYYIANPNSFGFGPCVAIPAVVGCIDALSCNYNPLATIDDGSCVYPTVANTDCSGACLAGYTSVGGVCVIMVSGCMDSNATNYDATANFACFSCCNYNGVFDPNCIVATTGYMSYQTAGPPAGRFLNWSNMTGATGYVVRWSGNNTFLYHTAIPITGNTNSGYTIPTNQMTTGQTYYWQVAKVCSTGQSDFSATKSFVAGGSMVTE